MFFFFSSRRRHTRSYGDWSSDVCSSDLDRPVAGAQAGGERAEGQRGLAAVVQDGGRGLDDQLLGQRVRAARGSFGRSEERRVGKECRSGGWPSQTKKDGRPR